MSASVSKGSRLLLLTTPIFYVNAEPHIGHLYSAALADACHRYASGQKKRPTFLSTGTDEHGLKIQEAAQRIGIPPKAYCDQVSASFRTLFDRGGIKYDRFIRTTDPDHISVVQKVWAKMQSKGYIYQGTHEGYYSVNDETFYTPSQIQPARSSEKGKEVLVSIETGSVVEWTKEENYKFRLSAFRDVIREWLLSDPNRILPKHKYQEILSSLDGDILDLSISRPSVRLSWGISVPNDPSQVVYVWLDALVNYLTVSGGYPSNEVKASAEMVHFMGKDIIRFHCIYWPAFLAALDLPLPQKIIAHGHFLSGNVKMSKSRGNVIHPSTLLDKYGTDATRYFLLKTGQYHADAEFSEALASKMYKSELLGQLGNFCKRATAESLNPRQVVGLPDVLEFSEIDLVLIRDLLSLSADVQANMVNYDVAGSIERIFHTIAVANRWWDSCQPWKLKNPEQSQQLAKVLFVAYECMCMVAVQLLPVMPEKMNALLDALNVDAAHRDSACFSLHPILQNASTASVNVEEAFEIELKPMPTLFPRV